MAELVFLGITGVVLLQFVLAIAVYLDANRRRLEYPELYFYGISVPLVGFFVLAVYLSRRRELPTVDLAAPTDADTTGEAVWTIENAGLRRLPRRLGYAIQGTNTLWRVAVAVPPVLLILAVLLDPRIAIALFAFCGVFWLLYLGTARWFTDTSFRLDPDGTIQVTLRGGEHPLSPSAGEHEIELADVERAELRRVGRLTLVRLEYETPFSVEPRFFAVPADQVSIVRDVLATHGVRLRDRLRDGSNRRGVWRRYAEGLLSLVAVPLCVVVLWPEYAVSPPVPILALFAVLWLVVKFLAGIYGSLRSALGVSAADADG